MKNTSIILIFLSLSYVSIQKMVWMADLASPGARFPIYDIYDGNSSISMKGQLNPIGMRQQYLLGTYLRADYIDKERLIQQIYNPNTVEVFACGGVDRTYDSAISRLYGLFPLGTGWRIPQQVPKQRWEPPFQSNFSYQGLQKNEGQSPFGLDQGFMPVPVWPLDDYLNPSCPNFESLKQKRLEQISALLTSIQYQQMTFIQRIKSIFSLKTSEISIPSLSKLYDTLISDLTLGKKLPESFTDNDMRTLKYLSDYYNILLYNGNFGQISATLTLELLKSKIEMAKIGKIGQKKWSMFFARQQIITPLLNLFNLTSTKCLTQKWKNQTVTDLNCVEAPGFSTNMLIELHVNEAFIPYLKIKYNGYYANLCQTKETVCDYNNFWSRLKINKTEYDQSCFGKLIKQTRQQ